MKKTIVNSKAISPRSSYRDATYTLYFGIDTLEGGWMITNEGDPRTAYDLDSVIDDEKEFWQAAKREKEAIEAIISDPSAPLEEITSEDIEYVNEWLDIWGCEPIKE